MTWFWLVIAVMALTVMVSFASLLHEYLRKRYSWGHESGGVRRKLFLWFWAAVAGVAGAFSGGRSDPDVVMMYDAQQDIEADEALDELVACLAKEGQEELAAAWRAVAKAEQVVDAVRKAVEHVITEEEKRRKQRIAQAAKVWISTHQTSLVVNRDRPGAKEREELVKRLIADEESALLGELDQLRSLDKETRSLVSVVLERTRAGREHALSRAITDWSAQRPVPLGR